MTLLPAGLMLGFVIAALFFWPAVIASIVLVFTGILRRRSRLAFAGGLVACPFLLYLVASPRIGWLAAVVGAIYLAVPLAVAQSRRALAFAMTTPFVALASFIARLVLSQ